MSRSPQRPRGTARRRAATRGAAMIVVLAIMIILLAIALTFYSVSRVEFNTSTNVINSVRSDLQADAAIEIAIAHLNEDFLRNPGATSTDHSWRSYFSGAWAAGKTWLTRGGQPLHGGGLPEINLYQIERDLGPAFAQANLQLMVRLGDGRVERLFRGTETRGWLYIPRLQRGEILLFDPAAEVFFLQRSGNTFIRQFVYSASQGIDTLNPALNGAGRPERFAYFQGDPDVPGATPRHPFVTSDLYGRVLDPDTLGPWFPIPADDPDGAQYPAEQVHAWADIDNDGDGLRDSLWFPIQADTFFPDDGADNNLSGIQDDSPNEAAPFVYYGMGSRYGTGDGRDNDGNGVIDDEFDLDAGGRQVSRLYLTVPLPGLRIQIDLNNDGLLDERDLVPVNNPADLQPVYVVLPDVINVQVIDPETGTPVNYALTAADVDQIDNDFNGEVNETDAYAYIGPHSTPLNGFYPAAQEAYDGWRPAGQGADWANAFYANARERGYVDLNVDRYVRQGANLDIVPAGIPAEFGLHPGTQFLQQFNALRITVSGEPVCELVGRAAVHIADESAKLNANIVHALTYRDQPDGTLGETLLQRALGDGAGPHEIDLRLVPGMGVAIPKRIAAARYGAPALPPGLGLPITNDPAEAALTDGATDPVAGQYFLDVSLPGYGRVDDNGNVLLLALDGRNNNGSRYNGRSLADEGLFLPRLSTLARGALTLPNGATGSFGSLDATAQAAVLAEIVQSGYLDHYRRLGVFEGIDEPGEFRRFRSERNLIAEENGLRPGAPGNTTPAPIGTLGDTPFQSFDEIFPRITFDGDQAARFGLANVIERARNVLGVHSTDRNADFQTQGDGIAAINQIDLNRAPAQEIVQHLVRTADLRPATEIQNANGEPLVGTVDPATRANTHGFAEGLRQADTGLFASPGILYARDSGGGLLPTAAEFPADPLLQAMLAAVNLVDARDPGHARTTLRTENFDLIPGVVDTRRFQLGGADPARVFAAPWPPNRDAVHPRDRIVDADLLALEEIEEYFRTPLGLHDDRAELLSVDPLTNLLSAYGGSARRRLQALDAWWANFVTADANLPADGAAVAEQRVISYAAAGAESIRINELMVRPVRRVEAEAVTELVLPAGAGETYEDPVAGVLTLEAQRSAFRPTPPEDPNDPTAGLLPLPLFDVVRRTFNDSAAFGTFGSAWELRGDYTRDGSGLLALGDTAHLGVPVPSEIEDPLDPSRDVPLPIDLNITGTGPAPLPDVLEYSFAGGLASTEYDGLPPGRYYLTLNIAEANGNPSVSAVPTRRAPHPVFENSAGAPDPADASGFRNIYYAIKYVNVASGDTTILEDVATRYNDISAPVDVPIYRSRVQDLFRAVPPEHFSLGGFGERPGWVFLDGTPELEDPDPTGTPPSPGAGSYRAAGGWPDDPGLPLDVSAGAYFAEFDGFNQVPVATRFFGGLTHTVYVPPANSGWRLHVAVVAGDPNLKINFFDFSQEPAHEWVELANISDEAVDLGGWEFEVGIPDKADWPVDPFKSKWRVPQGTQIAPGGLLLLGFNKFDYFQQDRGGPLPGITSADGADAASLVFNNGMGLAAGLPNLDATTLNLTALIDVTEPPIGNLPAQAAGDAYDLLMNDPALAYSDTTGSVFRRVFDPAFGKDTYFDFVDTDGDGITSAYLLDSGAPDTDNVLAATEYAGTPGTAGELRPWKRIVQLECIQLAVEPQDLGNGAFNWYDGRPYAVNELVDTPDGLDKLARLVLRGGVLPNYPEHDGIDNDGDGASASDFVVTDVPDPIDGSIRGSAISGLRYFEGILDGDMLDNDLDGLADLVQVAVDYDGNTLAQFRGGFLASDGITPVPAANELPSPYLSEGVDEGGNDLALPPNTRQIFDGSAIVGRRYAAAGSFERTPLPVRFLADREVQQDGFAAVGNAAAGTNPIADLEALADPSAGAFRQLGVPGGAPINPNLAPAFAFDLRPNSALSLAEQLAFLGNVAVTNADFGGNFFQAPDHPINGAPQSPDAPYLGDPSDSPEWQAFVERRWNPGDNVIVTLYAGGADQGKVADRVTYREYDVINRTIDDGVPSPYEALDFATGTAYPAALNPDYPSMWLPDHMGLDFYRSLERKDPFYAGDRFGTSNRWEATDGNYDDWAESLGFFEWASALNGLPATWATDPGQRQVRFDAVTTLASTENRRLLGHALFASPLRMNTVHRVRSNPPDLLAALNPLVAAEKANLPVTQRPGRQFLALENHEIAEQLQRNPDWSQRRAVVRNAPFQTAANVMEVPLVRQEQIVTLGPAVTGASGGYRLPWPATPVNLRFFNVPTAGAIALRIDPAHRGAVLAQGADDPIDRGLLAAALESSRQDDLVLTAGQAEFRPIRPDLGLLGSEPELLQWLPDTDPTDPTEAPRTVPPGAWMPVFFASDPAGQPYEYPPFANGQSVLGGTSTPRLALFNPDFLTNRGPAPFGDVFGVGAVNAGYNAGMSGADIQARYAGNKSVLAYVAAARVADNRLYEPEGLFLWDAADGLENGEYTVHIGTFLPGLNERAGGIQAQLDAIVGLNAGGVNIQPYPETLLSVFGARDFLRLDPSAITDYWSGGVPMAPSRPQFKPRFVVEIITEPSLAQGVRPPLSQTVGELGVQPGLTHPDDWFAGAGDAFALEPGDDGYILYGTGGGGTWRPTRVNVTKNFLALRVRQVGAPNEVGVLTHVVLSPRKRTPGRVNINTVENRVIAAGGTERESATGRIYEDRELFNPLMGVPGVFDALTTVRLADGNFGEPYLDRDNVDPVTYRAYGDTPSDAAWQPPTAFTNWNDNGRTFHNVPPEVFLNDPTVDPLTLDRLADTGAFADPAHETAALRLSTQVMAGRTKRPDGRYYLSLEELARPDNRFPHPNPQAPQVVIPPGLGNASPLVTLLEAQRLSPLSNAPTAEQRFDETLARFGRMAASITTRSDVFEIQVTVQSGYALDINGDAKIDYRGNEEFITTGEKKARVVYERRAPADRSDDPE